MGDHFTIWRFIGAHRNPIWRSKHEHATPHPPHRLTMVFFVLSIKLRVMDERTVAKRVVRQHTRFKNHLIWNVYFCRVGVDLSLFPLEFPFFYEPMRLRELSSRFPRATPIYAADLIMKTFINATQLR